MTFLKFPGRRRVGRAASACPRSQLCWRCTYELVKHRAPTRPVPQRADTKSSEAASKLLAAPATCSETVVGYRPASCGGMAESADLRGELAHHIAHAVGKLSVLCGRGAPQRPERHRQLDRLDHPCAGDPERL